jgi:hypothetical protein
LNLGVQRVDGGEIFQVKRQAVRAIALLPQFSRELLVSLNRSGRRNHGRACLRQRG